MEVNSREGSACYPSERYENEKCNPEPLRPVFIVAFLPRNLKTSFKICGLMDGSWKLI